MYPNIASTIPQHNVVYSSQGAAERVVAVSNLNEGSWDRLRFPYRTVIRPLRFLPARSVHHQVANHEQGDASTYIVQEEHGNECNGETCDTDSSLLLMCNPMGSPERNDITNNTLANVRFVRHIDALDNTVDDENCTRFSNAWRPSVHFRRVLNSSELEMGHPLRNSSFSREPYMAERLRWYPLPHIIDVTRYESQPLDTGPLFTAISQSQEVEAATGLSLQELRISTCVMPFENLGLVNSDFRMGFDTDRICLQTFFERNPVKDQQLDKDKHCQMTVSDSIPLKDTSKMSQSNNFNTTITLTSQGSSYKTCAICCVEFVKGDPLRFINSCHHRYHDYWFENNSTCPICRCNLKLFVCVLKQSCGVGNQSV